jgi:UDP-N-acetylmuramoylalanine--D-glutamate ligase
MNNFKKLAILGFGVSNRAVLREMTARSAACVVWDDRLDTDCDLTPLTEDILRGVDALIVAPGIAPTHETVAMALRIGVKVMCDVGLWRILNPHAQVIAVTGTNGKSTVTAMIAHILRESGVDVAMGGNIGKPVFDLPPADWTVLELSSFQIEYAEGFKAQIAALLNVSPDHLDRHGDMAGYAAVKAALVHNANEAVIAIDDDWTRRIAGAIDGCIKVSGHGSPRAQNEAVASAVALLADVSVMDIQAGLDSFTPLPHRQTVARVLGGVTYINDSKATNVDSARAALLAFDNIIWIVGGKAKDGGLAGLETCLGNVDHALVIGADMGAVVDWLEARGISFDACGTMTAAVKKAEQLAESRQTVLLSPACASYDQYSNFEERGADFEAQVMRL